MFTTQNIPLILLLAGCIALFAGLSGGGFTFKDYSVPKIKSLPRVISGLVGAALIGTAIWLYARHPGPPVPAPTEVPATETASLPASATPNPTATPTLIPSVTATFTETPAPGTPTAVPASPTPIVADPTNPIGFLRYYFDMLTIRKNYGDAWQLLSKAYQKQAYSNSLSDFGKYWSGVSKVDINDPVLTLRPDNSVDCFVELTLHLNSGLTSSLAQKYHLIYDSTYRTWTIDVP